MIAAPCALAPSSHHRFQPDRQSQNNVPPELPSFSNAELACGFLQTGEKNSAENHRLRVPANVTKQRALDWLQKGCDEYSDHVLNMGQDPVYDPLRSAPRFVGMLR